VPTYNERETLPVVLIKVLDQEGFDVLVVDDNSPDGTAQVAEHWRAQSPRVHLLRRPRKMGLGTAYLEGFRWGLQRHYQYLVEMDSDMSHNPQDLPRFLEALKSTGAGLVVGSRYLQGRISVVGWNFKRLMLSKLGNLYAAMLLGLPLTDLTSGYRAYSRQALEKIDLEAVHSEGYAFQIEMAYRVYRAGLEVLEIPIVFTERRQGASKMSKRIVREALWIPWRLRFGELKDFWAGSPVALKEG